MLKRRLLKLALCVVGAGSSSVSCQRKPAGAHLGESSCVELPSTEFAEEFTRNAPNYQPDTFGGDVEAAGGSTIITVGVSASRNLKATPWRIDGDVLVPGTVLSLGQGAAPTLASLQTSDFIAAWFQAGRIHVSTLHSGPSSTIFRGYSGSSPAVGSQLDVAVLGPQRFTTAFRTQQGKLRVLAWRIPSAMIPSAGATLEPITLTGSADAGAVSEVRVATLSTQTLVTALRTEGGNLRVIAWSVSPSGELTRLGTGKAGGARGVSLAPASDNRVVTALTTAGGKLRLIVWKVNGTEVERVGTEPRGRGENADIVGLGSDRFVSRHTNTGSEVRLFGWLLSATNDLTRVGVGKAGPTGKGRLARGITDGTVLALDSMRRATTRLTTWYTYERCCKPECFYCGTPDGCGGVCMCEAGEVCVSGDCCKPSCEGKACGDDDGCDGTCVVPDCTGKSCGSDGCGGICGVCNAGDTCVGSNCCTPSCEGKSCGDDDGCGGTCVVPDCSGKSCGSDGCGGICGECSESEHCNQNNCETRLCFSVVALGPPVGETQDYIARECESNKCVANCTCTWTPNSGQCTENPAAQCINPPSGSSSNCKKLGRPQSGPPPALSEFISGACAAPGNECQ